jgi:hypothetical protein
VRLSEHPRLILEAKCVNDPLARRPSILNALTNPTVKAAIDALQKGDRKAWSVFFKEDAELYDDGNPAASRNFTRDGLGHE